MLQPLIREGNVRGDRRNLRLVLPAGRRRDPRCELQDELPPGAAAIDPVEDETGLGKPKAAIRLDDVSLDVVEFEQRLHRPIFLPRGANDYSVACLGLQLGVATFAGCVRLTKSRNARCSSAGGFPWFS